MATYVPKNYREVEAIQLPLAYNKHHLESITKWLSIHAAGHTFSGSSTKDGGFVFDITNSSSWLNLRLNPSDYIFLAVDGSLRVWSARDFEEEYSPKPLLVDGSIITARRYPNIVPNPPTNVFGGFR